MVKEDRMNCGVVQRYVPLWQVTLATIAFCVTTTTTVGSWAAAAATRDALIAQHQVEQDRRIEKLEGGFADVADIKAGVRMLLRQRGVR